MPFINVKTNAAVSDQKEQEIKSALGQAITTIPGKTENWLMVGIEPEYDLWFKGTDEPAAMVDVSIFGSASPSTYSNLTAKITAILSDSVGVPADRVYVKYSETENWGWNGSNF